MIPDTNNNNTNITTRNINLRIYQLLIYPITDNKSISFYLTMNGLHYIYNNFF
jgi:hypothetical protein